SLADRLGVQLNYFHRRGDVIFGDRLWHAAGSRVVVTGERSHCLGHACTLLIRFASHDRSDRAAERAAFNAIVTVAVAHDQRAEVRVTKPERAENMRVLRDFSDRIACVAADDLLPSDENAHRRFDSLCFTSAAIGLE